MMYISLETSVTAGDANSQCLYKIPSNNTRRKVLYINGQKQNVEKMLSLIVCGNSMKEYNIYDGNRVYVNVLSETEKSNIEKYPVIVYDNKHRKHEWFSHYKLRKFVGYVNDIDNLFETYKDRIKTSKELFEYDIQNSSCDKNDLTKKIVLSETFDKKLNRCRYSLHHAENIVGVVKYKH